MMMGYKECLVLLMSVWLVAAQRPSFAGTKPIGFPEVSTPGDGLGNRFGDEPTGPLPIEAKGDRALVAYYNTLPVDKQPFWFINWKAAEANRKNPQTYPQRENSFTASLSNGGQSSQSNSGSSGATSINRRQVQQGFRQNRRHSV